jgi:hypothetical protein
MSDESQGPGWWQASDLKWYPPELRADDEDPSPPPQIGTPSAPTWDRKPLAIAAGAVIVVIVAATVGYFLTGPKPQPSTSSRPFTMSQPSNTISQPPSPTIAPVAEAALDGLLLSPDQINTTMRATGMTVSDTTTAMSDDNPFMPDKACQPIDGNVMAPVYAGSWWTAFREQVLQEPGNTPTLSADQGVVLFPSAHDADAFFTASTQSWPACSNRQYTLIQPGFPDQLWTVGPVSNTTGALNATETRRDTGWTCQRALTVAKNVAIDVRVCGYTQSGAGVDIAHQIAAKVPR